MREQERLLKEWERKKKEKEVRKAKEKRDEKDNCTTKVVNIRDEEWEEMKVKKDKGKSGAVAKVKSSSKDKFPGFKKKAVFGSPVTQDSEALHLKLQESVLQSERYIKDDSFNPGLFVDNIKEINLRIDILRKGRDPDSPVRDLNLPAGPSQQQNNDNDNNDNNEDMDTHS